MGVFGSKPEKQSQEELNAVRKSRVDYQDFLNNVQINTTTDINNKALTPETGKSIFSQIQSSYDWLKKNPNANLSEVLANKDATTQEIQRLIKTDVPKRKFNNTLIALPSILDVAISEKLITDVQKATFLPTIATESQWYKTNQATATEIDFSQELLKIDSSITTTFVNTEAIKFIKNKMNDIQNMQTSELQSEIYTAQQKQSALREQTVDVQSSVNTVISTSVKVFMTLLIITLCLLSGSFAANFAIGRVPAYRVLYFLYGCVPIFVPFVLLYTIYKRVKDGRIPIYAMLPISIEPSTTRLGRLLWSPFYWIPDQQAMDAFKLFNDNLLSQVV